MQRKVTIFDRNGKLFDEVQLPPPEISGTDPNASCCTELQVRCMHAGHPAAGHVACMLHEGTSGTGPNAPCWAGSGRCAACMGGHPALSTSGCRCTAWGRDHVSCPCMQYHCQEWLQQYDGIKALMCIPCICKPHHDEQGLPVARFVCCSGTLCLSSWPSCQPATLLSSSGLRAPGSRSGSTPSSRYGDTGTRRKLTARAGQVRGHMHGPVQVRGHMQV